MSATAISSVSLLVPRPWALLRKKEGHAHKLRESKPFRIGRNQVRLMERENNGRKAKSSMHSSSSSSSVAQLCSGNDDDTVLSMDSFKHGMFVEDRFVYRQTFVIQTYQIGPNKTTTMESLMNLLQVLTLLRLFIITFRTWVAASGKNGIRRDWIIREYNTKKIIAKATSNWVVMNRVTRRLSKLPEEVREEIKPFFLERRAIFDRSPDDEKIDKLTEETAEHIKSGLASVPMHVLEDYHLTSLKLHYRRECRQSNLLESLTSIRTQEVQQTFASKTSCEGEVWSIHLLRLQADNDEIVRARAEWQHK